MGYVLLGHGGLHADPAFTRPDMEIVAIPQGTRIQFYCDAGQSLTVNAHYFDIWETLQAPWPPLDCHNVTYNLSLQDAEAQWPESLANDPKFGGHTLVLPGRDGLAKSLRMCTGSPDTCPTTPEQVAGGMTHRCGGVLAHLHGDLYWLACTSLVNVPADNRAAADAVLQGKSRSVVLGADPDWVPGEPDQEAIARVNGANVAAAPAGVDLPGVLGGSVFLVGDDHDEVHRQYANFQDADTFPVRARVSADNPALLEVLDVPFWKQEVVRDAVSRLDHLDVVFV
ncbi:hypothetical protein QZN11_40340 [Streptomyces gramineus]|uniref:putative adhesin n=1 Tax=Streptomyces gramineus TaxID=910542 RepID=UPI00398AFE6F